MYNLPLFAADPTKKYQHSPVLKYMHLYITRNQLPLIDPAQSRFKIDALYYAAINKELSTSVPNKR